MTKTRSKTRALALFLAVLTLFGILPMTASASTIADGSKTCTIAPVERHFYLTTTAGTRLGASAYRYTTNDGLTGPAYCIDHGLNYSSHALEIRGTYTASPFTAAAFATGYPQHSLRTFLGRYPNDTMLDGLTEDEYGYATQLAVWATLGQLGVEGTRFTAGRETVSVPTGDAQKARVFHVIQLILNTAATWDRIYQTGMYIRLEENALGGNISIPGDMTLEFAADQEQYGIKREVIGGTAYYTREYIFASATSTYYSDYCIELWADGAPDGAIFVDADNHELPRGTFRDAATWTLPTKSRSTTINDNGFEYSGVAKLCIPVDTAPNKGEITVRCGAYVMQYQIYLAHNKTSYEQSYIISDPSKGTQTANAVLKWGSEQTEMGALQITKVGGGGQVLAGATFTLNGSDGSSRTGTTDSEGVIRWTELKPSVEYTLVETEPPAGYAVVDPINVTVQAARVSFVTVQDSTQKQLTVRKIDAQTGYSLRGATIAFEQIDGSFRTTAVTDHAGVIQFNADALPIGSYKVYEASAPEGYEPDETVQTVDWNGRNDVTITFKDVRKPTLEIYKCDTDNLRSLPGASFEVYRDGQLVTTVTTNDNGLAYVPGVTKGYYTVKETVAPAGYVLDASEHSVYVDTYDPATTSDPRIVITNSAKPHLRILKYDAQTNKPLSDTTFEVYRDGALLGQYTTNAAGEIYLYDLEPGTYLVKEIAVQAGYTVNSTPQQIEIKAGVENYTLTFLNLLKPGIHLVKLDSQTMQPLANARFRITQVGGYSKEFTTDRNGEIDLSRLETGSYTVEELSAPDGYLIDDAQRIIKIEGGENAVFVFTDTRKPSFSLVKLDAFSGERLPGATFRIAKIEDGSHYLDRITDINGEISISDLEPGVYSVSELSAPEGYIPAAMEYHVELVPGQQSRLVLANDRKPDLRIIKKDADTGLPLEGTTFRVNKADGSTLTTKRTDKNGEIFIEDLEPGVYQITETAPPVGYLPAEQSTQLITLVANKTGEVVFENHVRPSLTVNKLDSVTGDPIKGAKFRITYASSNTFSGEINELGDYFTDENGQITLSKLKDGWYRVTELAPAAGYAIKEPAVQDFYIRGGESKSVTFENVPLSALIVYKYDSVTGEAVEGAVFQIKYLAGTSGTGGTVIGTYKTSVNGSFTVTELKAGTYIAEELASDSGHVIDTAPQTAYLSGREQDVVQLYFGNTPKGSLVVKKVDAVTGAPLSGVEFMVTTTDGTVIGTANGKFVTDVSGNFSIGGLNPGTSLVVKETRAKAGYILDDAAQAVTVIPGKAVSLEFRNYPKGSLIIRKYDSVTGAALPGAEFKITTSSGELVAADEGMTSTNGVYVTDENGEIILTKLAPTTYVVTETKAPANYKLDARAQTVRVNAADTQTIRFYNVPQGGLVITKSDEDTGERISGVKFEIRKMNGEIVGTYTTDRNGVIQIPTLERGWYAVTELKAADGYKLDATPQQVEVKDGQTACLELTNVRVSGICIHKTDSVTGRGVYGVKFMVFGRNNRPVEQLVTDQNGYAYTESELTEGRYYIREIEAAEGYIPDTQDKSIYVSTGRIATIEWKNTPITGQIQITKTSADYNSMNGWAAGTPIPNTVFEIYNKAGRLVETVKTDKNGVAASNPLPLGRYWIVESQAASFYALDKTPIEVEIEFAGQIVRAAMTNKSLYTNVSITKRGYSEVMPGQSIRYDFSGIANNSTTALESFFWRDTLPTGAVRLDKIVTGTWNASGNYKIVYKTNYSNEYKLLADSLSTAKNYVLDASPAALGLANGEVVTEFMAVFGAVPSGFRQVEAPKVYCKVLSTLAGGTQFTNVADVGGVYNGQWIMAVSRWVTTVYKPAEPAKPLPRTGY